MTHADKALLLLLLLGIGFLFRGYWSPPTQADSVAVTSEQGRVVYSLDEARELHVHGPLGETRLQIADGQIRFVSSPCRHKICVRSGWHDHSGAIAACVPNRISLVLQGQQRELDAVSY